MELVKRGQMAIKAVSRELKISYRQGKRIAPAKRLPWQHDKRGHFYWSLTAFLRTAFLRTVDIPGKE
jgi:hypothetical protein